MVRKWFWSISFGEGLRGKPADYVTRYINDLERFVTQHSGGIFYRSNLNPEDFLERRFIRGKALSSALATMFALNGARSLVSGELIDPENYMLEFSGENFEGLYPLSTIRSHFNTSAISSKIFANIVVVSESERKAILKTDPKALISSLFARFGEEAKVILDSQFISLQAANIILEGSPVSFFANRACDLYRSASNLATTSSEPRQVP
jgi:hypothetical protein